MRALCVQPYACITRVLRTIKDSMPVRGSIDTSQTYGSNESLVEGLAKTVSDKIQKKMFRKMDLIYKNKYRISLLRSSTEFYGDPRISTDLYVALWSYTEQHGAPRSSSEL